MPETSILPMRCSSRLNKQIIGRPRLTASLTLALSERRKSLLNQITFTDTPANVSLPNINPCKINLCRVKRVGLSYTPESED